jgi:hypothetical protein
MGRLLAVVLHPQMVTHRIPELQQLLGLPNVGFAHAGGVVEDVQQGTLVGRAGCEGYGRSSSGAGACGGGWHGLGSVR